MEKKNDEKKNLSLRVFHGTPHNKRDGRFPISHMRIGVVESNKEAAISKLKNYWTEEIDSTSVRHWWIIVNLVEQEIPKDCSLESVVKILQNAGIKFVDKEEK